ncbi:hypothetical protein EP331_10160 [bacterium]|nr:MAG: hypothetical protein EP331_10160 [bacterium]
MKKATIYNPGKALLPGFFLLLISCSTSFESDLDLGKTIATVNDYKISSEFFEEYYIQSLSRYGFNDDSNQRFNQLNDLIDFALLEQHAKEIGLNDSITQAYSKLKEDRALSWKWLEQNVFKHIEEPNEAQNRTAYFRSQKTLYVRQLYFIKENDAQVYYSRLQNGEDFIRLAQELYNTSTEDTLAGFIGKVSYFDIDDKFAEVAWSLPYNQYSEPFRTRTGFYIIRVENAEYSPMLTEQQYKQNEKKVAYKVKNRIYNLEADSFIREFMQQTKPITNELNIRKVYNRLIQIPGYKNIGKIVPVAQIDIETALEVQQDINPQDPLIEYELNGEKKVFTASDYVRWLPELSLTEAKNRTVASVGRALWYQVASDEARRQNMLRSTKVQFERDFNTFLYLAGRMQDSLRSMKIPEITDDSLMKYYERLGFQEFKAAYASYWTIPVSSFWDAEKVLNQIKEEHKNPESFVGYELHTNKKLDLRNNVEFNISKLNAPIKSILSTGNKEFYVFEFFEGYKEYKTFEEQKDNVRKTVERGYNEVKLLSKLIPKAAIKVDTAAFKQLMEYYNDIHISDKTLN